MHIPDGFIDGKTAAATALLRNTKLSAKRIAEEAMAIAGKICIYTNDNVTYEELG